MDSDCVEHKCYVRENDRKYVLQSVGRQNCPPEAEHHYSTAHIRRHTATISHFHGSGVSSSLVVLV